MDQVDLEKKNFIADEVKQHTAGLSQTQALAKWAQAL